MLIKLEYYPIKQIKEFSLNNLNHEKKNILIIQLTKL
jgi:hypothetical protein